MSSTSVPAVDIAHVAKSYGETEVLHDLSLTIPRGEFFGFLGPNGAGKSTTIHLLTGIARMQEGSMKVFGYDVVDDYREARRHIGLSPQENNVDVFEKITNILDFVGGYYGMNKAERNERVTMLLDQFDLTKHAHKEFRMLSGGLKRRVMLARAMIHDPDLLILDEPTAGVDVELRHELWRYLEELNKAGKTIFFTSHYLEEVERLCNRIAILYEGRIVDIGDKSAFTGNGKHLEDTYLELTQKKNHAA